MGSQSGMLCGFVRPNDSRDDFVGNEIHTIFFQEERKARAASEKSGAQKRAKTLRRAGNSRSALGRNEANASPLSPRSGHFLTQRKNAVTIIYAESFITEKCKFPVDSGKVLC